MYRKSKIVGLVDGTVEYSSLNITSARNTLLFGLIRKQNLDYDQIKVYIIT